MFIHELLLSLTTVLHGSFSVFWHFLLLSYPTVLEFLRCSSHIYGSSSCYQISILCCVL